MVSEMAGGKLAADVTCMVCLVEHKAVVRARRIYEGDETDRYECEKGHVFGMDWPDPAAEPQWPPSAALLAGLDN